MRPAICSELERRGVTLRLEGERLLYRAPKGSMTPSLRSELKRLKPEMVAYLKAETAGCMSATDMVIDFFDGELERAPDGLVVHASFFLPGPVADFHGEIIKATDDRELETICGHTYDAHRAGELNSHELKALTNAVNNRANLLQPPERKESTTG